MHKNISNGDCEPITVYRCSYADPDEACGFDGQTCDLSHDECHHPFSLEEAERFVACWNYCIGISTQELKERFKKYNQPIQATTNPTACIGETDKQVG